MKINEEVAEVVEGIIEIASAEDLKYASEVLSEAAVSRHEAEKLKGR